MTALHRKDEETKPSTSWPRTTFHGLRHTFATELFNQRKRPKIIQSLLGHSSIVQTMDTYSHLLDDVDDDEVGGLDEAFG